MRRDLPTRTRAYRLERVQLTQHQMLRSRQTREHRLNEFPRRVHQLRPRLRFPRIALRRRENTHADVRLIPQNQAQIILVLVHQAPCHGHIRFVGWDYRKAANQLRIVDDSVQFEAVNTAHRTESLRGFGHRSRETRSSQLTNWYGFGVRAVRRKLICVVSEAQGEISPDALEVQGDTVIPGDVW